MSYLSYKNIGTPLTRVMEECAEVIQAACKIQRFGWLNYNPDDIKKETNVDHLLLEMQDVIDTFDDLKMFIANKEIKNGNIDI